MKNEGKSEQLRVLIARVDSNLKDIGDLDMAGLSPWWPTLSEKALAINEDLRILLPLAAEVQPYMVEQIVTMKAAVVDMRIDSYNRLNDVTASKAAGKPVNQEVEVCPAMRGHGITDSNSPRAVEFCLNECRYQNRCLATEPGEVVLKK